MTPNIAYHLGQFVAVTMPPLIDHPCEQSKTHDCPMCNGYESAKLAAIESGVPFSDQKQIEALCWEQFHKIKNGVLPWQPKEGDTFTVEGEVEIKRQARYKMGPEPHWYDVPSQYGDHWSELTHYFRKVAVFKSPAPAKEAESPAPSSPREGKWISVKERLPELGDEYLVVWDLKDGEEPVTTCAQYDAKTEIFFDETYPDGIPDITHWAPLPSPPDSNT